MRTFLSYYYTVISHLTLAQFAVAGVIGNENDQPRFLKGTATPVSRTLENRLLQVATTVVGTLSRVGNNGIPLSAFPLQKCQGDCDSDADCFGTLKCFHRNPGDDIRLIPGCAAINVTRLTQRGVDYCYDPSDTTNTTSFLNGTISIPINQTEPKKRGTVLYVGEDWKPKESYPLDVCEGDCDGDYDCAGELICFHRDKALDSINGGIVPGCVGRDTTTRDYCIHPNDTLVRPPVPNSFRLKKYWQFGYKWQDEFWEQEWCMECTRASNVTVTDNNVSSSCAVNDSIIISHCSHDRSTWFKYKNLRNDTTQLQIAVNNTMSSSQHLCLQLVGNTTISIKVCDGTNQRQKFRSLNGLFGKTNKFEIGTIFREGCISNHHHPKDGELLYRENCTVTRKHTTSYWTQY